MLRTSLWKLIPLCMLAHASLAAAQQSTTTPASTATPAAGSDTRPAADPAAPPKLDRLEEGNKAPIRELPRAGERKITEKKENGRTTEVKVKSGKSSYTMKPYVPAGNAVPGDIQSGNAGRAPQWTVLEFDLNKKKKTDPENVVEPDVLLPKAPPPPRPAK